MVHITTAWGKLTPDEDHCKIDFSSEPTMSQEIAEHMIARCHEMKEFYKTVDARPFDDEFDPSSIDTKKKRHHFVPLFWQRKFADRCHTVEVDLNSGGRMHLQSPKDTGVRKQFYNLRSPQGRITYTGHEDYLAHYESEASRIIKRILGHGVDFLDTDTLSRFKLSHFFVQCILRTSETERRWIQDWRKLRSEVEKQHGKKLTEDEMLARTLCDSQRLDHLLGNPKTREAPTFFLFCRRWTLIPYTNIRLALPFDPIINFGSGAKTANMILIPLDRKKMLVLHWAPSVIPVVKDGDKYLICSDILNHVQDRSGGKMVIHPDDQKFWKTQIKAWEEARPSPARAN